MTSEEGSSNVLNPSAAANSLIFNCRNGLVWKIIVVDQYVNEMVSFDKWIKKKTRLDSRMWWMTVDHTNTTVAKFLQYIL